MTDTNMMVEQAPQQKASAIQKMMTTMGLTQQTPAKVVKAVLAADAPLPRYCRKMAMLQCLAHADGGGGNLPKNYPTSNIRLGAAFEDCVLQMNSDWKPSGNFTALVTPTAQELGAFLETWDYEKDYVSFEKALILQEQHAEKVLLEYNANMDE